MNELQNIDIRAQDLSGPNPAAFCGTSSAQGRTVGGSACDRILFFFTAADCRHSSSSVVGSVKEAFKVDEKNR